MSENDSMNAERSDLFWAVVEHVRSWIGQDGPLRRAIVAKGKLDGVTLRRIAITYNVNRGIRAKEAGGDAEALAKLINEASPWPTDLVDRAQKCKAIAREAEEKYTHGIQYSAITKFSWFAQPNGWTVYDRFVARAMGVHNLDNSIRMVEFYKKLQKCHFQIIAAQVQTELDRKPFMELRGTRVLDILLMLTGAKRSPLVEEHSFAERMCFECNEFLNLLPTHWREDIEEVAQRVDSAIDPAPFLNG